MTARLAARRNAARVDAGEVARFEALAERWWDPAGPMRALHRINPVRLGYVRDALCRRFRRDAKAPLPLAGLRLLDVGCGAGLLCEPLARLGAAMTGLDPAAGNLRIARAHAAESGLDIDYRAETIEDLAARGETFDAVLALEVVEHVPDVPAFVAACAAAVAPEGLLVLATLNRTLRSFALAIVGAEYVLRWVPRGTHDWDRFVTPDELVDAVARGGLTTTDTTGMVYQPLRDAWALSRDCAVNYLMQAERRS